MSGSHLPEKRRRSSSILKPQWNNGEVNFEPTMTKSLKRVSWVEKPAVKLFDIDRSNTPTGDLLIETQCSKSEASFAMSMCSMASGDKISPRDMTEMQSFAMSVCSTTTTLMNTNSQNGQVFPSQTESIVPEVLSNDDDSTLNQIDLLKLVKAQQPQKADSQQYFENEPTVSSKNKDEQVQEIFPAPPASLPIELIKQSMNISLEEKSVNLNAFRQRSAVKNNKSSSLIDFSREGVDNSKFLLESSKLGQTFSINNNQNQSQENNNLEFSNKNGSIVPETDMELDEEENFQPPVSDKCEEKNGSPKNSIISGILENIQKIDIEPSELSISFRRHHETNHIVPDDNEDNLIPKNCKVARTPLNKIQREMDLSFKAAPANIETPKLQESPEAKRRMIQKPDDYDLENNEDVNQKEAESGIPLDNNEKMPPVPENNPIETLQLESAIRTKSKKPKKDKSNKKKKADLVQKTSKIDEELKKRQELVEKVKNENEELRKSLEKSADEYAAILLSSESKNFEAKNPKISKTENFPDLLENWAKFLVQNRKGLKIIKIPENYEQNQLILKYWFFRLKFRLEPANQDQIQKPNFTMVACISDFKLSIDEDEASRNDLIGPFCEECLRRDQLCGESVKKRFFEKRDINQVLNHIIKRLEHCRETYWSLYNIFLNYPTVELLENILKIGIYRKALTESFVYLKLDIWHYPEAINVCKVEGLDLAEVVAKFEESRKQVHKTDVLATFMENLMS